MEATEQNVRDANAILQVARALETLWQERPVACRAVLNSALDQFWEAPRVAQGKRRDPKALWTADALTTGMAAQREDRHTGKRSALWDKLVIEQLLPVNDQAADIIELSKTDSPIEAIIAIAEGTVAILTSAEHAALADKGFGDSMPEGWQWGDDKWARFRAAGWPPEDFKPWAGLSADPFKKIVPPQD